MCAVYGEGAVSDQTCQKWFSKFCTGDFSLDDAPWSGRPVEVDSDQIKTIIEKNQYYTTQKIADILKISKSIKLLVKMKNVSYFMEKKNLNRLFGQLNTIWDSIYLKYAEYANLQRENADWWLSGAGERGEVGIMA